MSYLGLQRGLLLRRRPWLYARRASQCRAVTRGNHWLIRSVDAKLRVGAWSRCTSSRRLIHNAVTGAVVGIICLSHLLARLRIEARGVGRILLFVTYVVGELIACRRGDVARIWTAKVSGSVQ